MKKDYKSLREEYSAASLHESHAAENPFVMFAAWFDDAIRAALPEPNAMTLATAGLDGKPSARVVLLKEMDGQGFVFFTNYHSKKGRELSENPHAAGVFLWLELQRQVRIEGRVHKISEAESDDYFFSRPRESQLGAVASPQSTEIPSAHYLFERFRQFEKAYAGKDIPRPGHWGGYRLVASSVEFWQGRPGRLHDRLLYVASGSGWTIKRLAP